MLTRIIYKVAFRKRVREISRYATKAAELQQEQLSFLLKNGSRTAFGWKYALSGDCSYEQFSSKVPLHTYDEIKPWIERMLHGERSILWPGLCRWFAKSSGTTSDKSKFIPVTSDALHRTHYRGGTDVVAIYLSLNPQSRMMSGKGLILGGSSAPTPLAPGLDIRVGDLSACLIQNVAHVFYSKKRIGTVVKE